MTMINEGLLLNKEVEAYILSLITFLSSKWGISEPNSSIDEYVNAIATP